MGAWEYIKRYMQGLRVYYLYFRFLFGLSLPRRNSGSFEHLGDTQRGVYRKSNWIR